MTRIVAVVPARTEADRIGATVCGLLDLVTEVVVVDDGSADRTAETAAAAGAQVVRLGVGRGKGGAIERGIAAVREAPDLWLLADGDLAETAEELRALLAPVRAGDADVAIAVLPPQGGGFGFVKRFSRGCIRALSGFPAREPLSGQRALSAAALDACRPIARGFGAETAMTIDAARMGLRIVEIPVELRHRPTGRDIRGFLHRGRQGWDIFWAVVVRAVGLR